MGICASHHIASTIGDAFQHSLDTLRQPVLSLSPNGTDFTFLNDKQSKRAFNWLFAGSQVLGGLALVLVTKWMNNYEGGFIWGDPVRTFNYHPVFNIISVVLLGEAVLVYRVFHNKGKRFSKTLHVIMMTMVTASSMVASKAIYDTKVLNKIPHAMSLHSWVGLAAILGIGGQYAFAFACFVCPTLPLRIRQLYMPFHQAGGMWFFATLALNVGMGIAQRAAWHHTCWTKGHKLCGQQIISNLLGVTIFLYASTVLILVANPRWKRSRLPEEVRPAIETKVLEEVSI
ncbi:unnamed protein product [Cylicocyclus nassatus]|uniref:Cytochrome b561 domain-containing protein n=1 Tax=Cylicocyclus nassatus TaxID=53992 RepID=A0AA36GXA9_CYLNA|nr:unnamed protein product [Cylicocyclus nassatus]